MTNISGLYIANDSGPVPGSADYNTLVILHGFIWDSGSFARLLPIAKDHNARVVLVNRRGYSGSTPFTDAELALLPTASLEADAEELAKAKTKVDLFMKLRAREVYDLLVSLVQDGDVPPPRRTQPTPSGGIVLVGWSFGTVWANAFLTYVPSFTQDVALNTYLRRIVCYDPAYHIMGYPMPEDPWNPVFDSTLGDEERVTAFNIWASGHYKHGNTLQTLVRRETLRHPPPTVTTLSPDELTSMMQPSHMDHRGPESLLLLGAHQTGLLSTLRKGAMFLPRQDGSDAVWDDVELRYVWCTNSVWETVYSSWLVREEMQAAEKGSVILRKISSVHIEGANHFCHWERPEVAITALLGSEIVLQVIYGPDS